MGLSSSKTKSTQNTNQTTSGTQTPITPGYLTDAAQDYVGRIGAFGDMDPNSFVAGPAPLQRQAWDNASQLGGWRPQAATASGMAFDAGNSGANLAGAHGNPRGVGTQYSEFAKGPGHAGTLQLPASNGLLSPEGYSAAPSDPGYAMPRAGQPIGSNPALTGASQAGAYQDPFQQQVIDTSLAGYDQNAAQQQAQLSAAGARNGAFGGSRFGLAEGQLGADLTLGRGQLESGLRSQGFNTANQFGMQDAAAGNQMNMFNAGQRDNADNRQLQAAGLLGSLGSDYANNSRADIGLMNQLGGEQRGIEADYNAAGLAQLQAMGLLNSQIPYSALVGQQVNGTQQGTMTGTQTSKPSLFNMLMGLGQTAASAYSGGMGG